MSSQPERRAGTSEAEALRVRVDGLELHGAEMGRGRPLLLLHGLSDSHGTWSKVAPALAASRRVLMLDLAGHGLSDRPDASYTLAWHAGLVIQWLDVLGVDEVDVVGHSFGGGVALWMLLEHRRRVRRLALVASGGLGREVGLPLRLASLPNVVERFGQPFMGRGTTLALGGAGAAFDRAEIRQLSRMNAIPGTARAFARSVRDVIDWRGQHRRFFDRAREIHDLPPIALFWGARDPIIPIAHAFAAVSRLEGVELTCFHQSGHFPHREEPARFVEALESYLEADGTPHARLAS